MFIKGLRISKACVVGDSECQFNLFRLRLLQIDSVVVRILDDDAPRPLAQVSHHVFLQLQSVISKICGHYCIYYCVLRSRAVNTRKIVRSLSSDTSFNVALVYAYACKQLCG